MGSAALIGLGLAQAQPKRRVLVVTGDGEQLMGLGGLATIAIAAPKNLTIAVIDNGHFGETGMQKSHTGHGLDIAAVATACGFAKTATLTDLEQVNAARRSFAASAPARSCSSSRSAPKTSPAPCRPATPCS